MFEDEPFFIRCMSYLEGSYFSDSNSGDQYLAWIYEKVRKYYDKYNERPTFQYLGQQIKGLKEDKQDTYLNVLIKIKETEVTDRQFLKDELTVFIRNCEFKKMHVKAAELFNNQLFDKAFTITEEYMEKINSIQFSEDDYVKSSEIDSILVAARESHNTEIPIMGQSFKFDEYREWSGKISKQAVTTIIAGFNIGKTSFSINCAYHAAMAGNKTLFIFHEGRKSQIVLRFLSRISGIPFNTIKAGLYLKEPDEIRKIEKAKAFIDEYIRIKEMRHVGATVEDVYRYCKNMKRSWNFDMMVDDYGQVLFPKKKYAEMRHNHAQIWNTFDQMSAELNIAILTCAQLNRDYAKKNKAGDEIVRSLGVSEAIGIAHKSETILTLNKSSKQENNDEMIVCLDKARDDQAGMLIKCTTDMRKILTHDSSYGMLVLGYDGMVDDDE